MAWSILHGGLAWVLQDVGDLGVEDSGLEVSQVLGNVQVELDACIKLVVSFEDRVVLKGNSEEDAVLQSSLIPKRSMKLSACARRRYWVQRSLRLRS
jgi:hypothetical protein